MPDFLIATSSTSDLPRAWLDAHGVPFVRYGYTVNGEAFSDDCREESRAALYERMRGGDLPKTLTTAESAYYDFFAGLMREGRDVIFLDMSRKVSTSYQNCVKAAERVRTEHPERKLCVMDTRCVSGGLGLLVAGMVRRMESGASFDETLAWGEAHKLKIAHRFTVDDLKYLKAGGRVSNASALVGSLLSIKPVLYVSDGGTLDVVKKTRGRRAALDAVCNGVLHDLSKIDATGAEIRILHADCPADAEYVRSEIKKACPQAGGITIESLGVVVGAHCGPGLLAAFYLCDGRSPD